ncbi:MAG TPA: hypothetical protein VGJ59_17120, partial [Jatrophihabitantaceae bacterium]
IGTSCWTLPTQWSDREDEVHASGKIAVRMLAVFAAATTPAKPDGPARAIRNDLDLPSRNARIWLPFRSQDADGSSVLDIRGC